MKINSSVPKFCKVSEKPVTTKRKGGETKGGREKGGEVNELAGKYLGHTYLAELKVASAAYLARVQKGCGCARTGTGMKTERAGRLLVMPA